MPVLSTRNKIRDQLKKAAENIDIVLRRLQRAEEVAAGQHPRLNEFLPALVVGLEDLKKILMDFREEM